MTEQEKATTRIAKRLAKEAGMPVSMWELFLIQAYREYHGMAGRSEPAANG